MVLMVIVTGVKYSINVPGNIYLLCSSSVLLMKLSLENESAMFELTKHVELKCISNGSTLVGNSDRDLSHILWEELVGSEGMDVSVPADLELATVGYLPTQAVPSDLWGRVTTDLTGYGHALAFCNMSVLRFADKLGRYSV